jgi:ABC-type antimicrobial peptide transport system permease subunit
LVGLVSSIKRAIDEVGPEIEIEFQTFKTQLRDSLLLERLVAMLSGFFGGLALVLVCIGLYGIVSYSVASRTNEIGIRLALGARSRDVLWLILREALLLVSVGVALGVPVALGATRLLASLLFALKPTDPVSLSLAALLMLGVAIVAGYLPARRATKVDPMVALRCE